MTEIRYRGWTGSGTSRCCTELTIAGDVIKESEKQIVIKGLLLSPLEATHETTATIRKANIVSRKEVA